MKEKQGEHPFGDAGQLIALALFLIVWVVDSFFIKFSTFLSSYVPSYVRVVVMLASLVASIYLVKSGHVAVSGEQRPGSVLSAGAFKYVRHPLYLAGILFYLALTVSTVSIISFALSVAIFIFYNYIAGYEEKLMELKFGEEYRSYEQKTGKWLPRVW